MKKLLLFFSALLPLTFLHAENGIETPPYPQEVLNEISIDELDRLQLLIGVTKENLSYQTELLALLKKYKTAQDALMADDTNNEKILATIDTASQAWNHIEEHNLSHLFREEYFNELKIFAQVPN